MPPPAPAHTIIEVPASSSSSSLPSAPKPASAARWSSPFTAPLVNDGGIDSDPSGSVELTATAADQSAATLHRQQSALWPRFGPLKRSFHRVNTDSLKRPLNGRLSLPNDNNGFEDAGEAVASGGLPDSRKSPPSLLLQPEPPPAIGPVNWRTACKRCLLHNWSDVFNAEDEKLYQATQRDTLAPLFKALCILTVLHFGFMAYAVHSGRSRTQIPALILVSLYGFVLPVTLALPFVAYGHFQWGRQAIVVLNAYAFAYVVIASGVACHVAPGSFPTSFCASFQTLSAAQSMFATLGPLFFSLVGRLNRGISLAVGLLLVALLGWTLSDDRAAWQTVSYMTGFYVWLTLLSYWNETVDREKHILRRALIVQVEATLRAKSGEVREAASKRRFVSYIFHELRVPMNTFGIGLGNLEEEGLFAHCDPAQQAVLDAIKSSFNMMESVLNDVLDFEKMQEGRFSLHSEPFDVNATAQATVTAFANVARDKDIVLASSFEERLSTCGGGWVLGDDIRYRQILNNYISNALKFTSRGGSVSVTTSLRNTTITPPENTSQDNTSDTTAVASPTKVIVRTSVTDTGCGIAPENVENLFKPYIQIDSRLTQNGKGTGLGLAICKHIVELAGGTCGVDSTLGQGSTFWFELELPVATKRARDLGMSGLVNGITTSSLSLKASASVATSMAVEQIALAPIPLQQTSSARLRSADPANRLRDDQYPLLEITPVSTITPAPSGRSSSDTRRGRSLLVLSADDDPITRMLMNRLLTQMGHGVVLAHDGRHALSLLARHNRPPGIEIRDEAGADAYLKPFLPSPTSSHNGTNSNSDGEAYKPPDAAEQLQPFDVILLDNQMPICTGEEAVRIITKEWKMDIAVIGITGKAQYAVIPATVLGYFLKVGGRIFPSLISMPVIPT
ncbi:HisKA [Geranomyces michiganensis]|nr:HisKA [Geranomyces michiganensis]